MKYCIDIVSSSNLQFDPSMFKFKSKHQLGIGDEIHILFSDVVYVYPDKTSIKCHVDIRNAPILKRTFNGDGGDYVTLQILYQSLNIYVYDTDRMCYLSPDQLTSNPLSNGTN